MTQLLVIDFHKKKLDRRENLDEVQPEVNPQCQCSCGSYAFAIWADDYAQCRDCGKELE